MGLEPTTDGGELSGGNKGRLIYWVGELSRAGCAFVDWREFRWRVRGVGWGLL